MIGLSAVPIRVYLESRIFLRQLGKRHAHLFPDRLGLWLDRDRNNGYEFNGLETIGCFSSQIGVAGHVFQPTDRADVARENFVESSRLLACILSSLPMRSRFVPRVQHRVAGLELAGIDRINVSWPTNGSAMILNASAENGSLSAGLRVITSPLSGLTP
jgi:hypothetical protein